MKKNYFVFSLLVLISIGLYGQHEKSPHDEHPFQHHRLGLFTGYGLIEGAINEDGQKKPKVIPVLGLTYEYWINHKFGIGWMNDLELSSYVVENEEQNYIDRNYALVSALVFLYEPVMGWTLFAGPGYEFESSHSFALFKLGTDVLKMFENGWSSGISVAYDIKEVNSSLTFGIIIGKRFGKK